MYVPVGISVVFIVAKSEFSFLSWGILILRPNK